MVVKHLAKTIWCHPLLFYDFMKDKPTFIFNLFSFAFAFDHVSWSMVGLE